MRAQADGWISFLNREAEALEPLRQVVPVGALRGHLRDRLRERYAFPMRTVVRVLVVGERRLEATVTASGGGALVSPQARFLELWPEGLTRAAAALTGPILVPCARRLLPGSVLVVALLLEDPTRRELRVPGLLAQPVDFTVEVAVEP